MRPTSLLAILLAVTAAMAQSDSSQQPFQPSVPASSGGGFGIYGGIPGGGTVEGSMMQGMASVISAQGNYNLATSAAAVNATQAIKQDIQNRQAATNAYFAMRETNRAATAAKRSPRLNQEQLVRLASQAAPMPIDSTEMDPVSGKILWPEVLRSDNYKQERAIVERLVAQQAQYGKLGFAEQEQVGQAIEDMSNKLRDQIRDLSPSDFISTKNFLKSLMYGITKTQLA